MVMSDVFTDDNKYNTFVESIITDRVKGNTDMINLIKSTCEQIRAQHILEFNAEKEIFTTYEKDPDYLTYSNYKVDNLDSTNFEFNYTTDNPTNEQRKTLKTALKKAGF